MTHNADHRPGEPTYERCQQVLRRHEARLLALPDVVGVGVSKSDEEELGLVLLMRQIPEGNRLEELGLPDSIEGIPVWPRAIGSVRPHSNEVSGE